MESEQARRPRGPRGRLLPVLLGVVIGAGAVLLVLLATDNGDEPDKATTATTEAGPSTTAPGSVSSVPADDLDPDAREMVALAEKGRAREFHARYEAQDVRSRTGQAFSVALELWNRPPQVRRDVAISSEGQAAQSTDIRTDKLVLRCGKPSQETPWQCATVPIGTANEPGGTAFGLAPAAVAGRPVAARDETVADRPARCFTVEGSDVASAETLCLSRDGIPLRVTSGAAILELTSLELSVEEGVFEPPARPVGS